MKVADIYYQQMEKPDRDYTNAQRAEQEYRNMINMFPDSTLVPRAKQKLRDVQEVLAERETEIGLYYGSRENFPASIARLETVVDTYPLYSKSDQALLGIGDAYAGEAHAIQIAPKLPGAIKERLRAVYQDRAAEAYAKVITALSDGSPRGRCPRPAGGHEPPRSRAYPGSDGRERSRRDAAASPCTLPTRPLDIIKHGPSVVEAVHVGEPSLEDPKRTLAPDITKQNMAHVQRRRQRRQARRARRRGHAYRRQ